MPATLPIRNSPDTRYTPGDTSPDIDDPRVDPNFGVEHLLLGVSWFATEESFARLEALLSGCGDVNARSLDSVLSTGSRFDFQCRCRQARKIQ